jgi:excinuclease ABC subunit B
MRKTREEIMAKRSILDVRDVSNAYRQDEKPSLVADPIVAYMSQDQLEKAIADTESKMKKAAKELDFVSAAHFRDEVFALKAKLKKLQSH